MSLLNKAMQQCVRCVKSSVEDGVGGQTETYIDGDTFVSAFQLKSSVKGAFALSPEAENTYIVTTSRSVELNFGDRFRRLSDGREFRVISDGRDNHTPESAHIDMRNVECEVIK